MFHNVPLDIYQEGLEKLKNNAKYNGHLVYAVMFKRHIKTGVVTYKLYKDYCHAFLKYPDKVFNTDKKDWPYEPLFFVSRGGDERWGEVYLKDSKEFIKWVTDEEASPFGRPHLVNNVETILRDGFHMSCQNVGGNYLASCAITMRASWEYPEEIVGSWNDFVGMGVDPTVALILAYTLRKQSDGDYRFRAYLGHLGFRQYASVQYYKNILNRNKSELDLLYSESKTYDGVDAVWCSGFHHEEDMFEELVTYTYERIRLGDKSKEVTEEEKLEHKKLINPFYLITDKPKAWVDDRRETFAKELMPTLALEIQKALEGVTN